jgi:hypothetical protein
MAMAKKEIVITSILRTPKYALVITSGPLPTDQFHDIVSK